MNDASTAIITRAIPSSGEALPVIGLGTWQTFDVDLDGSEDARLAEVLSTLARQPNAVVDSSPMYGNAESVVGALVNTLKLRRQLFVATKVWTSGKAAGQRQIEASMRKLETATLDLLQVHNLVDVDTQLTTLRELREAGRVRYIGVTHYAASAHAAVVDVLAREPVDFVQVNYSAFEREAEQSVLPIAQQRGIAVIANRPFASGAAMRRLRNRPLPGWAVDIGCTTWPQLLLKFIVGHPAITCTIPATANPDHLRDNLKAGMQPLPDAAMRERIAAAVS
ncbi:MAG TPA: aldo/keto reductase [Casimicrobiaceae bacterium]|nr:aldo/keto reductase [Casimicrobiaceae bacterium]